MENENIMLLTETENSSSIEFIYKGIRYVPNIELTDDPYWSNRFTYNNCNYLKYKPKTNNIIAIKDDGTNITHVSLLSNVEYYVNRCSVNEVELSLSQKPDTDVIGYISKDEFFNGIEMPTATIKFHPNGGYEEYGVKPRINASDKCSVNTKQFTDTELYRVDELFSYEDGYEGNFWFLSNEKNSSMPTLTIEFTDNFSDIIKNNDITYVPIYPETCYYLYAHWIPKTYTIFYNDGNGIMWQENSPSHYTSTVTYKVLTENILITRQPATGVLLGWDENPSATNPKYACGGSFYLDKPENITLYPIITSVNSDQLQVTYDPNGGFYGVRFDNPKPSLSGFNYAVSIQPTTEVSVSGTSWDNGKIPCRPGYEFSGWIETYYDGGSYPGEKLEDIDKNKLIATRCIANWKEVTEIIPTQSGTYSYSLSNKNYHNYTKVYKFDTCTANREVQLQFISCSGVNYTQARGCAMRIYDEKGETVPKSVLKWSQSYSNDPPSPTQSITLLANQKYYLEITSDKTSLDRVYEWKVIVNTQNNTFDMYPNGGHFKVYTNSSGEYSSLEDIPFSFNWNKWLGVSSNTDSALASFNGNNTTIPSLPNKQGYQYNKWIGTSDYVPTYLQTISSQTAWATFAPKKDFSLSALWYNNLFYIKYYGNNNNEDSHMANTSHKYDEQVTIGVNSYTRSTKINYISRKGSFIEEYWTDNIPNTTIIEGTGLTSRKTELNHSFSNWLYNKRQIVANYEGTFDNWVLTQLRLTAYDMSEYGKQIDLTAQWQFNSTILPPMEREGFIFMGWYDAPEGGNKIGDGGDEFVYEDHDITLYAHWDPTGLVIINTSEGWKKAVPYIYTDGAWKRALTNIYTNSNWQLGTNLGQNATDEQLEFL